MKQLSTKAQKAIAQSKTYEAKLHGIAQRLEEIDSIDCKRGFMKTSEELEYEALKKSYRGTAMAWIKSRKSYGLATDMIEVNWK